MNNKDIQFILNRKYFLKQASVSKRKWRGLIAGEFIRSGGKADDFIKSWDYLNKEGLIS